MHASDFPTIIDGIVIVLAGSFITWVIARVVRARQAETNSAIEKSVDAMKFEVMAHVDKRVDGLERSIMDLRHTVEAVDEREMETRGQVMLLKGRLDEIRAQQLPTPPA